MPILESFRPIALHAGLLAFATLLLSSPARAGDSEEFWPELNVFKSVNQTTRASFVAAYAKGRESDVRSLDLAGYLDVSLEPLLRTSLRSKDWRRNKYLWARVGYTHVFKAEGGARKTGEDRGVVALHARTFLPGEIFVEGRVRADFRWIGDSYSTRYRVRAEVNREFTVNGHVVTPYLQVEPFYDTRHDGWSRELVQIGAEVVATPHLRFESYVARQMDHEPEPSAVNAAGLVVKWYD